MCCSRVRERGRLARTSDAVFQRLVERPELASFILERFKQLLALLFGLLLLRVVPENRGESAKLSRSATMKPVAQKRLPSFRTCPRSSRAEPFLLHEPFQLPVHRLRDPRA
jgi:hypothetical protein